MTRILPGMTVLLILWVMCAGVAALIAQSKGRSVGGFAMAGLLLGLVGVIWAACARSSAEITGALHERRRGRAPLSQDLREMPPMTWRE